MAFLGTIDPNGWVICDGQSSNNSVARSNADGKYNNLIAAGIGSGTVNSGNYTPPNYCAAFLRGTGTSPTLNRNVGPSINTSQRDEIEDHFHNANFMYTTMTNTGASNPVIIPGSGGTNTGSLFALTDTGNNGQTQNTQLAAGGFSVKETRPYNYGVNWILKL